MNELKRFPLVSIIIPTYNRAELIGETLQSVKNQTYQNWECILVDDGSTDNTNELVNDLIKSENRIQFYKRDRLPKGAPTCRNIGLGKSKGEYVIFLDSDDLMVEKCLATRVSLFESNPDEDFIVFPLALFDEEKKEQLSFWNVDSDEDDLQRFLRVDTLWQTSGPFYKKEFLLKIKGFREGLGFWQDYDLHLRALLLKPSYKKFLKLPPDIFIRRHRQASVSQSLVFVSNKQTLQKRIEFFLFIASFVNENNIQLTLDQQRTLWSMMFYFSSAFLTEHKDRKTFLKYWQQTKRSLKISFVPHALSTVLAYLIYCRRFSIYFIKAGNMYQSVFGNAIVDQRILTRTNALDREYKVPNDFYKRLPIGSS